jgi:hypothetical protein
MKKFNQFLESKIPNPNVEEIANLIVESDFDYSKFAEWYVSEGQYINEEGMWQGIKNFAAGAANRIGQGLSNMGQNYAPGQGMVQGAKNFTQGWKQGGQNQDLNMKIQKAQGAMKSLQDLTQDLNTSKLLDQNGSANFMKMVKQINDTIQSVYNKDNLQKQGQQQQGQQQQGQQSQNAWQQGMNNMRQQAQQAAAPAAPAAPAPAMGSPYG